MAINGISTNYTNRKIDLSLFPGQSEPLSLTSMELGEGNGTRAVSGILKSSQNFLRILMTEEGIYKSSPSYGTLLIPRIKSGYIVYPADMWHLFASEAGKAVYYMRGIETVDTPDDEKIGEAKLDSFFIEKTKVSLNIVYSSGGDGNATILLPVKINI